MGYALYKKIGSKIQLVKNLGASSVKKVMAEARKLAKSSRSSIVPVRHSGKSLPVSVGVRSNPSTSKGMNTYDLYWSPTGQKIASNVSGRTQKAAIRKAPKPYSKYKGEIYAVKTAGNPANGMTVGTGKYRKFIPFHSYSGQATGDYDTAYDSAYRSARSGKKKRTVAKRKPAKKKLPVKRQKSKAKRRKR